jgi:ABC-type transporter Mla subunit MlaD
MSDLPRTPADLAAQLRAAAERLTAGWTSPTPPATLTTQQLQAVLDDLAARRTQVQALRAQLGTFDEQLAALETALTPLHEWTAAWSGFERAATDMWRPPGPDR